MTEILHRYATTEQGKHCLIYCPACEAAHAIVLHPTSGWVLFGTPEAPTLTPSLLSRGPGDFVCHSFVRHGVWEYLTDSTHAHAGSTLPAEPLPEHLIPRR